MEGKENETVESSVPTAPVMWNKKLELVKSITAKGCSEEEFGLLCHMAGTYGLDPLKKEIWAVKYANNPALIFVGRDGLLTIAHKSGQFGCIETSCEVDEKSPEKKPISATCIVYRKDYDKPTKITVYFREFVRQSAIWREKPATMLMKVAEAFALRRAFNVSGIYIPEEFDEKANGK